MGAVGGAPSRRPSLIVRVLTPSRCASPDAATDTESSVCQECGGGVEKAAAKPAAWASRDGGAQFYDVLRAGSHLLNRNAAPQPAVLNS